LVTTTAGGEEYDLDNDMAFSTWLPVLEVIGLAKVVASALEELISNTSAHTKSPMIG
jgi:hypothetical protein